MSLLKFNEHNLDKELTDFEIEYLDKHLPEKTKSEFYYDNPSAAIEDVEWLLEIINKLRK